MIMQNDVCNEDQKGKPCIEENIFSAIYNLQLETMVGWKSKGQIYSFLDRYDEAEQT